MEKLRFGLVGCGDIAHIRYFYSFERLPELIELVGIYDFNETFLKKTAAELGTHAYASFDELLADPAIEAVIVTTWHPSHAEYSIRALKAGKHVLSEKPIATSKEDALQIQKAALSAGKIYMALPNDEYPHTETVRRMIRDGVIGEVCQADGIFAHQGPLHAPWFFDRERASWGVLADLGVYPISLMTYLFGPVDSVSGKTMMLQKHRISLDGEPIEPGVEDSAAAILTWADGKTATIRTNWCTAADKSMCVWDLRIYGSRGIIFINMNDPEYRVVVYSPYTPLDGKKIMYAGFADCYLIDTGESDCHTDILYGFLEAVRGGIPIPADGCSIERQIHVIEIIDRIYQSSREGRTLQISSVF